MSDPRRVSDDLLIQLIREGRHDAEIGIRLGISSGDVRERKNALRGKLGDEAYYRAIDLKVPRRRSKKRFRLLIALAAVLLLFGILLGLANLLVGDEEQIAAVRVVPTATPRPTPRPASAVSIGSERFDDAGPFLSLAKEVGLPFVGAIEDRAALSVVQLHGTGYMSPSEFAHWAVLAGGRNSLRLRATSVGGRAISLQLNPANSATRLRGLIADVGPVAEVTSQFESVPPAFFLRAFDDTGRQFRTQVTVDGRLYISRQPIPGDWIIDRTTGSRVETADSVPYGKVVLLAGVSATTYCDLPSETLRCGVTWVRAQGIEMPFDGSFSCTSATGLRYEANGIRLDISMGFTMTRIGGFECDPHVIPALTRIIPDGDWEILAYTSEGEPLSVGVRGDGTLVVGKFTGQRACPCLSAP